MIFSTYDDLVAALDQSYRRNLPENPAPDKYACPYCAAPGTEPCARTCSTRREN